MLLEGEKNPILNKVHTFQGPPSHVHCVDPPLPCIGGNENILQIYPSNALITRSNKKFVLYSDHGTKEL